MTHPVPTPPARLLRGRDMADTLPPPPEPFDYCYEWETGYGIVRKFSATPHHGMPPTRAVALYTADQMRAALAAVPAQPVSDELIESLWYDAQRMWGDQTSVHPGEHVLFARLFERRISAAPQAVPVPAVLVHAKNLCLRLRKIADDEFAPGHWRIAADQAVDWIECANAVGIEQERRIIELERAIETAHGITADAAKGEKL